MRRALSVVRFASLGSCLVAAGTLASVGCGDSVEPEGTQSGALTIGQPIGPIGTVSPIGTTLPPIVNPPNIGDKVWDFEDGTLQGLVASGTAFTRQPTFGSNVSTRRATRITEMTLADSEDGALRAQLSMLGSGLNAVGGDYWDTPYPIGNGGKFWIGTAENRVQSSEQWGAMRGDAATGTLTSPSFIVQHGALEVSVGGGCDAANLNVRLEVYSPIFSLTGPARYAWLTATSAVGAPVSATGKCAETMRRYRFDISNSKGRTARIVVNDSATASPWGHIQVDDIRLTNFGPGSTADFKHSNTVFGYADLHTHLMNHLGTRAYNGAQLDAVTLWGNPGGDFRSYATPASAAALMADDLAPCNDIHAITGSYTAARDITLAKLEGAGLGSDFHKTDGGFPFFHNWPAWYSAVHEQMHVTWLHRAYQGGLRLMAMDVGNSEAIAYAMSGGPGPDHSVTSDLEAIETEITAAKTFAAQNSDWMEIAYGPRAARRIINQGKLAVVLGVEVDNPIDGCGDETAIRRRHAEKCSCAGSQNCDTTSGWAMHYGSRAADDPFHALSNEDVEHEVMSERPASCGDAGTRAAIQKLYALGVRKVIPTHVRDNELGGTALYNDLFSAAQVFSHPQCEPFTAVTSSAAISFHAHDTDLPTWNGLLSSPDIAEVPRPAPLLDGDPLGHVNAFGIGAEGTIAIQEMKRRGMLIDVQHSSDFVKDELLQTGLFAHSTISPLANPTCTDLTRPDCRAIAYPVLASHGGQRQLTPTGTGSENSLSNDQLQRLIDLGGLVGAGMSAGTLPMYPHAGNAITPDCGGSDKSNAQAMLHFEDAFASGGDPVVALGSDLNGYDFHAAPRFGQYGCYKEANDANRAAAVARQSQAVRYAPYPASAPSIPYSSSHPTMTPLVVRDASGTVTRVFDVNVDGLAHIGLQPDYLQDLANVGMTPEQRAGVLRSAEALIRTWEKACLLADPSLATAGCDAQ